MIKIHSLEILFLCTFAFYFSFISQNCKGRHTKFIWTYSITHADLAVYYIKYMFMNRSSYQMENTTKEKFSYKRAILVILKFNSSNFYMILQYLLSRKKERKLYGCRMDKTWAFQILCFRNENFPAMKIWSNQNIKWRNGERNIP